MNYKSVVDRMDFVVYGENHWRLKITDYNRTQVKIRYDAHAQSVSDAQRTIRNIVNISRFPISLTVIHGFNHGTAIKDMLANEQFTGRLTTRYCPVYNPGETIMLFAA